MASSRYDAFLSYSRPDEMDVRRVHDYLIDWGLKIWFDQEALSPGADWLDEMQAGLDAARTCLVFFRTEPGPWQSEETKQAIRRKTQDAKFRIIPVLLPGAPDKVPTLPSILQGCTWVDLRSGLFNIPMLRRLAQSISGAATVPIYASSDRAPADKALPTGYRADVGKVISLLIGESLYKQRDVAVRELVQNAVDACERRARSSFGARPEIDLVVDTDLGYFEVADNGEGMNPALLTDCFAVIGKSIREEEDILRRTQQDEQTRLFLIGKFGIGFISTYILARQVDISTTYEGHEQINLAICSIADPFEYLPESSVDRSSGAVGTTVRVYLREECCQGSPSEVDVLRAVRNYCRHVPYLRITKNGKKVSADENWNVAGSHVTEVVREPYRYELRLGLSDAPLTLIASNAGFFVSDNPEAIIPSLMPQLIGGEINLFPGVAEVNIARDAIVQGESAERVKNAIRHGVKKLLVKGSAGSPKAVRKSLRDILMAYLELATAREKPAPRPSTRLFAPQGVTEPPPVTSAEAAELLVDVWEIRIKDREVTFREALQISRAAGKNRVYWHSRWQGLDDICGRFKGSLLQRGFIVVADEGNRVWFRRGENFLTDHEAVLGLLAKRYDFELRSVAEPREADVEDILVPLSTVSKTTRRVIAEIQRLNGNEIRVGRLSDAPAAFHLAGYDYLNIDNAVVHRMDARAESRELSELKSYILGLLQYEFK